ncbi:protein furry like protein [Ditylenchus destructor]|uniref:Protein furry like protein n=1 Tax=Ditylenchus destructor TaxID=166010 RepID=A0AAD4NM49_9BILA|nr:protein furry like protein [Ditylenchus destructor]
MPFLDQYAFSVLTSTTFQGGRSGAPRPTTGLARHLRWLANLETRHSLLIENAAAVPPEVTTPLNRSKSATTLKLDGTSPLISEEEYTISINALCQLISISVAMLESSVDNEFLLALHLLDKILVAAGNEQTECFNRLEKTIKQLEWSNFPGIIGLASRGSVFHTGYEPAISILNKCVAFLNHPVVVTSNAIALIVTSVLPHCLLNFDAPTLLCCNAVQAISNYCTSKLVDALPKDSPLSSSDHPLHNLSTMMDQYSEHSFPRDRFQWAKCVVSYLVDAFNPNIVQIVVFLTEMLERSAPSMHNYLLNILNLFISYGDLSDSSPIPLNAQVIRVVSKHLQGNNSREASRILKCFVDQWNAISVNQVAQNELCSGEQRGKPTFDLYVAKPTSSSVPSPNGMANGCASAGTISAIETTTSPHTPRRSTVQLGMANQSDSLKRNMIQNRVRERLVSLLTASGLRAGLPKSSSVIFSQSTNDLNQLESAMASTNNMQVAGSASEYSSTERMSHQDDTLEAMSSRSSHIGGGVGTNAERASITTDSFPRVFREFDFLEAEHDSISESTDSCFNWLSTMRSPRCAVCHMDGEDENAGDEHDDDFLHPEDDYYEEDELGSNGGHSGAGSEGGKISREDRQEADDEPATLRSKVACHGGHRPFGIRPRRPLSRASKASDSNDISSDRTPIQSDKHSDESCPSCPVSEDEEDDVLGEEDEDELDQQRSGPSSPQKSKAKKRIRGDDSSSDLHRGQNEKVPPRNHQHQSIQQVRTPSLASSISPSQHRSLATTEDSIMETVSTIHSRSEYSAGNIMSASSWAPLTTHRDKRMPIYLECNHHPSGRVEEMWNSVVSEIAVDQEGEMTSSGILLFSQLLRESCVKLSVLLRDASHLMAMPSNQSFQIQSPYHNEKTAYLNHALNVVLIVADCPFLFVTPQFLRSSNLLQTQKFRLYELREHFETFSERTEQCIQALNSLKSSMKLHSLGGAMAGESLSVSAIASFSNSGQEVELCKCLHKLFFQLLLMLEKLNEMIQAIQQSSNSQEYDLSPAVACLHRDLLGSLSEVPASRNESRATLTPLRGSDRHSADSLVLHLTNKHYKNALMNVRHLRSQYGSEFGCCDHMDIEVLLLCFCRSHTLRTWAIVGHLQSLQQSCAHLKETNMQLASLLRMLTVASSAQSNSTQSESGNSGGNQPLSASMSLGTAGGRSTSRLFSTGGASSSTTLADIGGASGVPTPAAGSTIFGSPTSN